MTTEAIREGHVTLKAGEYHETFVARERGGVLEYFHTAAGGLGRWVTLSEEHRDKIEWNE